MCPDFQTLGWLDAPRNDAGIHVSGEEDGSWTFTPYTQLADAVQRVAAELRPVGLAHQVVAVEDAGDRRNVATAIFAIFAAGGTVTLLPQVLLGKAQDRDGSGSDPANFADYALTVREDWEKSGTPEAALDLHPLRPRQPRDQVADFDLALLQFTSGSSGARRGVRITHENLSHQLAALGTWLEIGQEDATASWLPLHHDMGLIGMFIGSITHQVSTYQMEPVEFLKRPLRWLRCFDSHGATVTALPGFACDYIARKLTAADLQGLDLSGWRVAIVGAERLNPGSLARFSRLLSIAGFSSDALRPAYGLAETTLAVAGSRGPEIYVATAGADVPQPLQIGDSMPNGQEPETPEAVVVSSGTPLPETTVWVLGVDGRELSDGEVGEIVVAGESVAAGYCEASDDSVTRFESGRLFTGDAGFLLGGELFVLGRMAEAVKARGKAVFVEELDGVAAKALGLPAGRVAVVAVIEPRPGLLVVVEEGDQSSLADSRAALTPLLESRVGPGLEIGIHEVPRNGIPRTASGKPQRRVLHDQVIQQQ